MTVRTTRGFLCAVSLMMVACGSPVPPQPDAGGQVSPPVDAGGGEDAGTLSDAGMVGPPCTGEGGCAIDWSESAPLPAMTDHHVTFAHASDAGTFLYVVGGVNADHSDVKVVYDSVRRARIGEDGALGAWEVTTALPRPLGFNAVAEAGVRLYLVAGVTQDEQGPLGSPSTLIGEVDASGDLTWRVGTPLNQLLMHPTAQVLGSRLYVVGGTGGGNQPKASVWLSTLADDGLNGAWTPAPALPAPRSHHATVVRDGRLYVIGGHDDSHVPQGEVLRSTHGADGALTGWELAGFLPDAPVTHSSFILGEWLYVVGGMEGTGHDGRYVARIRRARFDADGFIPGAFEEVPGPMPIARAHVHQTPVVDGRIYSAGGRLFPSLDTMDRVFIGTLRRAE